MSDKKIVTFEQFCECCIYNGVRMSTREHICTNLESDGTGTISPDTCPRWKAIDNDNEKIVKDFAKKFLSEQKSMPIEAQQILEDNFWDLLT